MSVETGAELLLRCSSNDGHTAVEICGVCDLPACEECVGTRADLSLTCRRCAYAAAVGGVEERAAVLAAAQAEPSAGPSRARKIIGRTAFALVVCTLAFWTIPSLARQVAAPSPYALGAVGDGESPGLDESLRGLWLIWAALDQYRAEHSAPPHLNELRGVPLSCPGCGEPWRYELHPDGRYMVACSRPANHERSGVFLDDRTGPPQVTLDARGGGR